jgi:hypothetical protein
MSGGEPRGRYGSNGGRSLGLCSFCLTRINTPCCLKAAPGKSASHSELTRT